MSLRKSIEQDTDRKDAVFLAWTDSFATAFFANRFFRYPPFSPIKIIPIDP